LIFNNGCVIISQIMEEGREQKELFEFEKPRRIFPGLGRVFSSGGLDKKLALTLTPEKVVFISIGIIMAMVVIYALGVEAGRSSRKNTVYNSANQAPAARPVPLNITQAHNFTIVAVTMRTRNAALREMEWLKKEGVASSVVQWGSYFQVRVGPYQSKDSQDLKRDLNKLKKRYKDAFIKEL